jgi:hypothetical protein
MVVVSGTALVASSLALAAPGSEAAPAGATETIEQALCRLIDGSARKHQLPIDFFTRLIWQESSFRTRVTSPAGAQGVAQFMPGTAAERGLADPFDPEQAIPKAAELLADLARRFGNRGLAAAAYNGGPTRVANWLERGGSLPYETEQYVFRITGRTAQEWADAAREKVEEPASDPSSSCIQVAALIRRSGRDGIAEALFAPWGVQLAANFSKERALASFARAHHSYRAVIGNIRPMILGTRLRSRGTRAFYRVRVPAATREAATQLCDRIRAAGGSCIVLRS